MDIWDATYGELRHAIGSVATRFPLFRGHSVASWKLLPALSRATPAIYSSDTTRECNVYFDFITRAGDLLPRGADAWTIAFAMQHHGLPTRLLDWTETLAVALHFAIREGDGDAAIWVLDPFALNHLSLGTAEFMHPTDLGGDYEQYFVNGTKTLPGEAVAISPLRYHPRVTVQRSGFTLHGTLTSPLEDLFPGALTKIRIPATAREGAREFLSLAGVSEFSLFPDLDGLCRELRSLYF